MLQAAICDRLSFDPFLFDEDGLAASEVNVRGGKIAEAFVVAGVIIVLDKGAHLGLEGAG